MCVVFTAAAATCHVSSFALDDDRETRRSIDHDARRRDDRTVRYYNEGRRARVSGQIFAFLINSLSPRSRLRGEEKKARYVVVAGGYVHDDLVTFEVRATRDLSSPRTRYCRCTVFYRVPTDVDGIGTRTGTYRVARAKSPRQSAPRESRRFVNRHVPFSSVAILSRPQRWTRARGFGPMRKPHGPSFRTRDDRCSRRIPTASVLNRFPRRLPLASRRF